MRTHVARVPAVAAPAAATKPVRAHPAVHAILHAPIQPKLKIGAVDDPLEHEADRVADQVMRMPAQDVSAAAVPPQISRKCPACEEEEEKLQKKEAGSQSPAASKAPGSVYVYEVLRSPGQPLDTATRAYFEPRFGRDFSTVRIHADGRAAESARGINALAYTAGQHVVFGAGAYAPKTDVGRKLLAHELTHVVQQSSPGDNSWSVVMRQSKPVKSTFSGCTGNQPQQIDATVQNAKRALNAAAAVVANAYGRPRALSAANQRLLMDHFHTTDHDHLRNILGVYVSVSRAFDAGLQFKCETTCPKTTTANVCGFAYNTQWFGGIGPIYVCFDKAGCDFAMTAANNQVALVIHEAAHRHAGVDDKVYRWQPGYATLSAKNAMDNADSYAWFAVLV